jgi:hypothetical protein
MAVIDKAHENFESCEYLGRVLYAHFARKHSVIASTVRRRHLANRLRPRRCASNGGTDDSVERGEGHFPQRGRLQRRQPRRECVVRRRSAPSDQLSNRSIWRRQVVVPSVYVGCAASWHLRGSANNSSYLSTIPAPTHANPARRMPIPLVANPSTARQTTFFLTRIAIRIYLPCTNDSITPTEQRSGTPSTRSQSGPLSSLALK